MARSVRLDTETERPLAGTWRYPVGDFRINCAIEDGQLLVLVLTIGHRSDVCRR